jgi:hypothetical protein
MLNPDRKHFVTASQAYRVMADFKLELAGQTMQAPDIENSALDYFKKLAFKPKVGELKKTGIELSGAQINEAWTYLNAITPVFSTGMESVAREIAMNDFVESRDESYKSEDMEHGNDCEGEAVIALSKHTGIEFTAIEDGQQFLTKGNLGVTPDGTEYDGFNIKSCAEVKCPLDKNHMKYLYLIHDQESLLKVMPLYYWQAQCGLAVTGAETYHWASYHNNFIESCRLVYVPITRNEEHIDMLIKRADRVIKRAEVIKAEILADLLTKPINNRLVENK